MTEKLLQMVDIAAAFVPVDMQTADNNGDWVDMAKYDKMLAVLFKGIGTAADDPVFKLQQADSKTGGNAKDLKFDVIYSKVGATALNAVGQFTRTTQTAATSYTDAASAENEAIIAVEIQASDLDMANGFQFVQLSIANIGGNAQLGGGFYIMFGARYKAEAMPSALG
ncbi:hypothetical protein LCGC14_2712210 [marine sediment metagenome]|uniref:Uncharacterized protein n=1 Tax=marine sediment metagenome TaxID=412755 RepID=A0A0F8ZCP3_9ZZZZ